MPRPGFNPNKEVDIQRLYQAIRWSRKKLEPFRRHNLLSIRQLAGRYYGDNENMVKVPINMLELAYTIYLRHLAGGTPRVHSSSTYRQLRPYAYDFELVMNDVLDRLRFVDSSRAATGNALLSMGIVKVGKEAGENIAEYSESSFVDVVHIDDWFHDMAADHWGRVQSMGNFYSMPTEVVKETGEFKKSVSGDIGEAEQELINEDGDERAQSVGVSQSAQFADGRIHAVSSLIDVYLPFEDMFITLDGNMALTKPLRVIDKYGGDEYPPYERLSYLELAGNTAPLPPSALWMDLHRLANNIFNKLENQANNARMVTTFSGPDGAADAQRMAEVEDGGITFRSPGSTAPETNKTNEIDQVSLAFLIQIKDLFGYFGGNLDALGGLGPQSPTLGQDQLLVAGASQRLAEMQDRTQDFQSRVIRTLARHEYDGDSKRTLRKTMPGLNFETEVKWDKATRKKMGPIENYEIKIAPYSSMGSSPATKLQGLVNIFNTFIVPMLPMWQQQGYSVDPRRLIETVSRLANMPELEGIISEGGMTLDMAEGQNSMPKSPMTKRTYERVSRSQSTRATRDGVMMRALLGQASQPSEANRLNGAVG